MNLAVRTRIQGKAGTLYNITYRQTARDSWFRILFEKPPCRAYAQVVLCSWNWAPIWWIYWTWSNKVISFYDPNVLLLVLPDLNRACAPKPPSFWVHLALIFSPRILHRVLTLLTYRFSHPWGVNTIFVGHRKNTTDKKHLRASWVVLFHQKLPRSSQRKICTTAMFNSKLVSPHCLNLSFRVVLISVTVVRLSAAFCSRWL